MFETQNNPSDRRDTVEKYYGKYPGVVVQHSVRDDLAGYGNHRGELLVEVPGILEETPDGLGQQPLQVWAKPCFLPGFFFIPAVDARVWVEFVAGDMNEPVWTGIWYPQDATPQTSDAQAPTELQQVIRTAAGHVLELDDAGGKIVILDQHQNKVILNEAGITITDLSNNQVLMSDAGVKVIDTSGNEIVMASGGVTITSEAIKLGSDNASEKVVLGDTLKGKLEELIDIVIEHVHPTGVGPSGTPVTHAPKFIKLKASLAQILSTHNTTD